MKIGTMEAKKNGKLLSEPVRVVNIGLAGFADELTGQGVEVVQVDWTPPAGGDPKLAKLLSKLGA